jgi:hypothetical protein
MIQLIKKARNNQSGYIQKVKSYIEGGPGPIPHYLALKRVSIIDPNHLFILK